MIRRGVSISIAAVTLVGVAGVAWWGFTHRTSPGPLHPSHAAIADLNGNRGCDACHGSGKIIAASTLDAACTKCHTAIADDSRTAHGLHGQISAAALARCESCHHEHVGDAVPLVSTASFRLAGIPEIAAYKHEHVPGFGLTGAHDGLACAKCHTNWEKPLLAKGETRFMGLSQACTGCHDDAHKGELGSDCASCHGQEAAFKLSPLFAHPESFPLQEGHAKRQCSECHARIPEYKGQSTDCASCHADTFDATTQPHHKSTGLGLDCATCHTTKDWTTATFTHPAGFELLGAHASSACAACHDASDRQAQVKVHQAKASCIACHASPHSAALIELAARTAGNQRDACQVCHQASDTRWRQGLSRFSAALHEGTGFSLASPHDRAACAACHAELENPDTARAESVWRLAYPSRQPDRCEVCHADPHDGQFTAKHAAPGCLACHERTRFVPPVFGLDQHQSCGFPLDGAHRGVACSMCHKVEADVRRFAGTPQDCAACHADVHGGRFDHEGIPSRVGEKAGCARCHESVSFAQVAWTPSEHKTWTGVALTGGHARATCNDCHRRQTAPARGPIPFSPSPKACAACHEDVHAGQFKPSQGQTDCAVCHKSMEAFKVVTFDHARNSRFTLDKDHEKLACSACHKPVDVGGIAVVRYKPLGTQCADCHDSRGTRGQSGGPDR